ncbi:MAG: hypothetical protein NDI60_05035 [Elusimicrobiales bacterium]|nr:hypothetical protein [Elusimicrobiales bacterium]
MKTLLTVIALALVPNLAGASGFADLQGMDTSGISKINPFPNPGNPDSCYLTGLKDGLCNFKCRSGETFQVKPVNPQASSVYEKCGGGDYRGAKDERASSQDQASAREIIAIAKRADSPFGGIEDGNLGLSAYRLTPEAANMTVKLVKKAFPGIALGNRKYAAAGPQLVLVITSDDEAYVHMYDQDPSTGKLTRIDDFNSVDAVEVFYGDAQMAALAAGYEDYDWTGVLQGLAGKGRGIPLPLGKGSAQPYWWSN